MSPPPSPSPAGPPQGVVLQELLAFDHAAIYGLAAGGGKLATVPAQSEALAATRAAFDQYRLRRDSLTAFLRGMGLTPAAAAPAYVVTPGGGGTDTLRFLAALADKTAAAYRAALAQLASTPARQLAVAAVAQSARYAATMKLAAGEPVDAAAPALPG